MTALLALHVGLAEVDRQRVLSVFRHQNPGPEITFAVADLEIIVTGNGQTPCATRFESGEFIAVAGVLIYKKRMGNAAAQELLRDLVASRVDEGALGGTFAAIGWDCRSMRFFTDWLGNMCAYRNEQATVWSTSFLATAASHARHIFDRQGAWEYIFLGASCGESTVLAGISRVDPEMWHDPRSGDIVGRTNQLPRNEIEEAPFNDVVSRAIQALDGAFDTIASESEDRIDTALSGGYDSRLIVAALRKRGVTPRVHVYGGPNDADVVIARSIAAGEGFEIHHTDKRHLTQTLNRDQLAQSIERNFVAFDGLPVDGIFDLGADLVTRQDRMAGGYLALNGGGGEVFRNFFYLPDRRIALNDLLRTFFSRFDPRACSDRFSMAEYVDKLTQKVITAIKIEEHLVRRVDIERVYPLFRCRYWMSHTTSINNQLGRAMTPLVHLPAVAEGLRAPIHYKDYGRLEAAMIEKLDPGLAQYRSNYRRSMIGKPTIAEKFTDYANLARPIWVRKLGFHMKQYLESKTPCGAWMREYGRHVPGDWGTVRELIIPERVRDVEQLSRIATLQFLCERVGVETNIAPQ